jgi:hypothetical protein
MRRILIALTVLLALGMIPTVAMANIVVSIVDANAPSGTHLQEGSINCSVDSVTLAVTCTRFELSGVGNTNVDVDLDAKWTATVDCFNKGTNPNNPIESHTSDFSDTKAITVDSTKNGRLTVPSQSVNPASVTQVCPNPNWTPKIRGGTLTLVSFTYTVTFAGFEGPPLQPYITITGP